MMLERLKQLPAFLSETRAELKKVTFPSKDEVLATTVVVVIASFIFAFFLFFADLVIMKGYQGIFRFLGT